MNTEWQAIPPGKVWLPVRDLTSAMQAWEILFQHLISFDSPIEPFDADEL